jgi:hypothetical protein
VSQWSRWAGRGWLMVGLCAIAPGVAVAAELDGSAPILCAVMGVTECDRWGGCEPIEPDVLRLPPFVRVNVGTKALEATDGSGRKTDIHSSMLVKEKERLILHGGEHGRAWSLVIGQKTGEMTAAIADYHGGFFISGVCTLPS